METQTITTPPPPAPLSPDRFHTLAERQAHKANVEAYWIAKRVAEHETVKAAEAERGHANRVLTDAEYEAISVERFNRQQKKELEERVAEDAALRQREALMASTPDTIQILESSPVAFLEAMEHRLSSGYTVDYTAMITALPNLFQVTLKRKAKRQVKEAA